MGSTDAGIALDIAAGDAARQKALPGLAHPEYSSYMDAMSEGGSPVNEERAARSLAALGNRTRLRLYRLLVRAGGDGLNVGDLQRLLGVPPSTLAHHLATLARAGLVTQERHGREVVSRADYGAMNTLVGFLTAECCAGLRLEREPDAA